jgi:type VI secretion system protein ImpK
MWTDQTEERMRADLAEKTFAVLLHGLALRDRLARGDRPHLGTEQSKLKALLGANTGPPWGGSDRADRSADDDHTGREFQGVRYALTCWLDEVLISAGWREWDENKLESALYRTNVRYSHFWAQARLAESTADTPDAHEAFLLCVLLGFRGEMANEPDRLREWVSAARHRVLRHGGREPPKVPERAPEQHAPPLHGERAYRAMTRRLVVAGLLAVPAVAFLLVILFR